ncbi:hypothetical protein [Vulgatibacter incomptus]|uniref:Vegetative protein n=1 Tax=Vulgatibacter incomptus TaxID=1391653 RepID=A0A0K1PGD2_9BACT|nr:hypothetical protein [Vulgatibacter incomptus]AKU92164.1 hypothetical protein AKJ08_2551 [Vulgatibacter incomptus]
MRELALHCEETFRNLGVRLGLELVSRLLGAQEGGAALPSPAPAPKPMWRAVGGSQAPRAPKILPGLTGRRRKPGEEAPRCGRFGCEKQARTRGYCQTHYVQWLKAGSGTMLG